MTPFESRTRTAISSPCSPSARRLLRRGIPIVLAVFVLAGGPTQAMAQSGGAGAGKEEARRLFSEGVTAAKAERWEEARDRFERSYRASPAPLTLFNLAGAQRNTGQLVAAGASYRQFLRQASGARHQQFRRAAENELAELDRLIPVVRVRVLGALGSDEASIDDEPISSEAAGAGVPVDPGNHVVSVRRAGRIVAQRAFEIATAQRIELELRVPLPAAPAPVDQAEPSILTSSAPDPSPPERSVWRSPWLWIGVAALAAGAGAAGYYVYDHNRDSGRDPTPGTLGTIEVP
jgi:hypothetical protein